MLDWLKDNETLMWTLTGVSVFMFVATLIALPIVVTRIPADYFQHKRRREAEVDHMPPALRLLLRIGKNVLGVIILLAGIPMLFLPGQGLLAILVGVLLIDFPGKYRFQRWLVARRSVQRPINWLRKKAGKPALQT